MSGRKVCSEIEDVDTNKLRVSQIAFFFMKMSVNIPNLCDGYVMGGKSTPRKKTYGKLRDGLEKWDDFIQIYLCRTCVEVSTVWANKILGKS